MAYSIRMTWVAALLLMGAARSLAAPGNIDVISRMDRSLIPYSGVSRSPLRRYRYPIYTKRFSFDEDPVEDDDDPVEGYPYSKRFLRGLSLRPLTVGKRQPQARYDISMTPYDLEAMAAMYQAGRRKRTPETYDLKNMYRIFEAGKKRSGGGEAAAGKAEGRMEAKRGVDSLYHVWDLQRVADAGKRSGRTSYYDLLDMAKMAKAGRKRSISEDYALWDLARLEAAGKRTPIDDQGLWNLINMERNGKRSIDSHSLLDLARIHDAGKRSMDIYGLSDLEKMQTAGKRSIDSQSLMDLHRMQAAGKRSMDNQSLMDLTKMQAAGKRSVDSQGLLDLARMKAAGKRSMDGLVMLDLTKLEEAGKRSENVSDEPEKRSFDDYFGWDRRKKKSVKDSMTDNYYDSLKQEVMGKTAKDRVQEEQDAQKAHQEDED